MMLYQTLPSDLYDNDFALSRQIHPGIHPGSNTVITGDDRRVAEGGSLSLLGPAESSDSNLTSNERRQYKTEKNH